ncbi:UNVERIFIED_CONTAM: Cytosolic endo-beta-N-acetylglucosaminidase 1 [Sesamum calycinum]|uniref:mannosyl-glycoprotein endo-beta-N-acetylglucosaminidase n=1 Tax=Sesamum calycinum TaxID=2727403 RepID=A0AAW2LRM4_9LAMI
MPLRAYIKTHHPKAFSALKNLRSFLSTIMEETTAGSSQEGASADAAPPFDPLVPAVPVSYPLKTLEELESRAYFKSFHYSFNQAQVKLQPAGGDGVPPRRRILVCHDMAGGYTDDRYVQGGKNADAYSIWHWYLIDVFVYFSHDLVTLPPPCWTNTAHRHGVKVLGTFIMEWEEGRKRADKLLSTKDSAQMYAERLTELAVALGFDGWLINMEVNLDPGQIPNLKAFVSYLSETMHSSLPGSLVIWYDSVTVDGELSWQNQLNDKNKPFFDLCDGIFVNYSWEKDFPKLSADVAGDRKFDVYMGIDVFGRGTYGGGQWTTNIALDVIKKNDVSAAIFAPGWIYETKQPPDFQTAQSR